MSKNTVFLRYEFTNESGRPEGGDIFEFTTLGEVQDMVGQILKVAQSDSVTVNLTIGAEKPFFGFLKAVGMSRKDAELEMVPAELAPVASKSKPKSKSKPAAKKKAKKK